MRRRQRNVHVLLHVRAYGDSPVSLAMTHMESTGYTRSVVQCVGGLRAWPIDGCWNKDVGRSERKTPTPCVRTNAATRQDKTRQDKTRQDKTRQDKTRQDKTRQDKTRQDKTRQDKTRQDKTRQDKTRQDTTRYRKIPQDTTRYHKIPQDTPRHRTTQHKHDTILHTTHNTHYTHCTIYTLHSPQATLDYIHKAQCHLCFVADFFHVSRH